MNERALLVGRAPESKRNRDGKRGERRASRGWVFAFVFAASQAMFCKGLVTAIIGPTLQFLGANTNSTMDQLSNVVGGCSFGVGLGAAAFSILKAKFEDFKPVKTASIALFALGMVSLATPFIRSLILLVAAQTVGGFALGYSETGLTSAYLTMWGAVHSRPYIQLNYFMFSIGGIIAPLIARPFLEMASAEQIPLASCPILRVASSTSNFNDSSQSFMNSTGRFVASETSSPPESSPSPITLDITIKSDPVRWPYVIFSAYSVLVSVFFFVIGMCNVEEKIREIKSETTEYRAEGSVKDLWMFFVSVTMYSFFCISSYIVYQSYIYSIVVCSHLKMSVSLASLLNSVFWGGFGVSRGSAVITSKYFQPLSMIIVGLSGTTTATVIMSIWGERFALVMWIGTFLHGIFVAMLLPSGISWSSQVTNMTGKYIFVYLLGGSVGTSIMLRIAGAVFQLNPFSSIYLVAGVCIATSICFVSMFFFAPRNKVT